MKGALHRVRGLEVWKRVCYLQGAHCGEEGVRAQLGVMVPYFSSLAVVMLRMRP
jgi:hypothetical protein